MILRSINSSTDLISFLLIKIQSSFLLDRLFFFYANRKCSMKNNLAQLLGPPVLPGPFRTTLFGSQNCPPKRCSREGPGGAWEGAFSSPENPGKSRKFQAPKNPGFGAILAHQKMPKNPPPRLEKFQGRFSVKPQRLRRKGLQGTSS